MEGPAPVSQETQTTEAAEAAATAAGVGAASASAGDEAESGPRLPDMTYTEQETELRSAVRSVLEDGAGFSAVLARI